MKDFQLKTPVALVIFNRPHLTSQVFEAIRRARPRTLFVIADGPRPDRPDDADKCAATRAIVDGVDWDCHVLKNYSDSNLGCDLRETSGLDWVFSQVDEAIILEDDCLPTSSFFPFCEAMLEKYRNNERILMIGGVNFQSDAALTPYSYYFSKYVHGWGWATWSRAWRLFDGQMKTWPDFRDAGRLRSVCSGIAEERYWTAIFDKTFAGPSRPWDYRLLYTCWFHDRLTIQPSVNLVSNIGFGDDMTHIVLNDDFKSFAPTVDLWDIRHPDSVERNLVADRHTFDAVYNARVQRVLRQLRRGFREQGLIGACREAIELLRLAWKRFVTR